MQAEVALRDGPGSELLANLWDWEEDASQRSVYLVFSELNQLARLIRSWPRSLALIDYFRAPTADRVSPGSSHNRQPVHRRLFPDAMKWAHLGTAPRAPVSDPASIEHPPETRRIGDRRSAIAAKSGAVSRCAR